MSPSKNSGFPPSYVLQTQLYQQIVNGYGYSQCLLSAVELGIIEVLQEGAQSCEELATLTQTQANCLQLLLRILVKLDILRESSDQRFEITDVGQCLLKNHPHSLYYGLLLKKQLYDACWDNLSYSLKTGESAFKHVYGMNFLEYLHQNSEVQWLFDKAVSELSTMYETTIVESLDLSDCCYVMDIGGGLGGFLAVLLKKYAKLHGILFEQPFLLNRAEELLKQQGVFDRCQLLGGDFLQSVPITAADVCIIKNTLNDLEDGLAMQLLVNCRRSMRSEARLLVIQRLLASNSLLNSELLNLHKFLIRKDNVKIRTEEELRTLLQNAGFQLEQVISTGTEMSVIEAMPV